MKIHILGVGSIGTLLGFHLQRAIKSIKTSTSLSSSSSLTKSSTQPTTRLTLPASTSLTLHLRRKAFSSSSSAISNRSSQKPSVTLQVESQGQTQIEDGLKVEYLPTLENVSQRARDRFEQKSKDLKKNQVQEDWKFYQKGRGWSKQQIHQALEDRGDNLIGPEEKERLLRSLVVRKAQVKGDQLPFKTPPINKTVSSDNSNQIDFLIITTKADTTLSAIRPLLHRIGPNSTILLLQNGLGVLDSLLEKVFTEVRERPTFILGITTHGAYRKKGTSIVHAGFGNLYLGVVPGRRSLGLEREALREIGSSSLSEPRDETEPINNLPIFLQLLESLPLEVHHEPISNFQLRSLKKLIINACINPITALLECRNGELIGNFETNEIINNICKEAEEIFMEMARRKVEDLEYDRRERLERLENEKLGEAGNQETQRKPQIQNEDEEEIDLENLNSMDLLTLGIMKSDSNGSSSALDPSLLWTALFQEVERIAIQTSKNWSSMAQDLGVNRNPQSNAKGGGRGTTEISFINGYLVALGNAYGIKTPVNEMMLRLVNAKSQKVMGRWKD